jgi:hypothetical protein
MDDLENYTPEQRKKLRTLYAIAYAGATIGLIVGLIVAYKRKTGFWGYVGFGILGSIVIGGVTKLALLPAANKLDNQADESNK